MLLLMHNKFSSRDFKNIDHNFFPTNEHVPRVRETKLFQDSDLASQESLLNFDNQGYSIIKYFDESTVDAVNREIESLLQQNMVGFRYGEKIMFAMG